MPIVPADRVAKLEFYEAHVGPWAAAAVSIGLTTIRRWRMEDRGWRKITADYRMP